MLNFERTPPHLLKYLSRWTHQCPVETNYLTAAHRPILTRSLRETTQPHVNNPTHIPFSHGLIHTLPQKPTSQPSVHLYKRLCIDTTAQVHSALPPAPPPHTHMWTIPKSTAQISLSGKKKQTTTTKKPFGNPLRNKAGSEHSLCVTSENWGHKHKRIFQKRLG